MEWPSFPVPRKSSQPGPGPPERERFQFPEVPNLDIVVATVTPSIRPPRNAGRVCYAGVMTSWETSFKATLSRGKKKLDENGSVDSFRSGLPEGQQDNIVP